jgi:nucleotide-binding universal stress UspA family protein
VPWAQARQEVVNQENAAQQIVAEAKKSHADLVVVGAQALFGSTTELVIRNGPARSCL